jgi:hypothetical protein
MVLDPSSTKIYDLRLIVCFAARSANPDSVHTLTFLSNDTNNSQAMTSSLAYKLYKSLDANGIKTKMAARLGEVRVSMSNDYAMDVLTQTEEGVIAGLALSQASAEEQRLGQALTALRQAELRHFINTGAGVTAPTQEELPWVTAYREFVRLQTEQRQQSMVTGQGRLIYEKDGSDLVVNFEDQQVYKGPFI